jgi:hypothetical protein
MKSSSEEQPLFREERLAMAKLLANNPNYFGTLPNVDFPVVQPIKFNTAYEALTCVGLWPERNLLEATIEVKLPFGFLGDTCSPGSHEYVRFFIDWNGDGDFVDANEDLGVTSVNVHDIPQAKEHHLNYAVHQRFEPFLANCKEPYIVKLRAILSWEVVPTGPNFIPIWGNVLESWVQIDPVEGKILGIVAEAAADDSEQAQHGAKPGRSPKQPRVEKERAEFLALLEQNPNYFGTLPISELQAINPMKGDTRYEELKCVGLHPEDNFLEAVLQVKLPYGYLGDLCTPGSYEYVRFFIDWNGDGDFVDFGEDAGVAAVNVHDIPQARQFYLSYALGRQFRALRATCQHPYIVKVRAILSWQQVPTGPNFIPVWGNVVDCWVQVRPTDRVPDHLVGQIDTPTADACVGPVPVPACMNGGAPLVGIQITGSAGGAPFDHYTLRYSWGGNPLVNDAVVYPDCSRPPANVSSSVPVIGGTLGYLDVTLLPAGVTEFTVYLDVYDAGSGHIAVTRAFKLKTTAVEITAAAAVNALVAEDPFHLGSFTKLIKATNDPSTTEPELSIGGAFSVTGSAYTIGCDRIMSQFVLARFAAPPAAPVPNFPNATGGAPLIAPVVYGDTPAHPWQSGCIGIVTPNTILNGNLVAFWSSNNCTFMGVPYTVPKVKAVPWWNSAGLNGRYVILLEVRDRLLPAGPFPGVFAAKDQVVVWIDNQLPTAAINSIGGLGPCADLHLKDYVGTTAEIRGVAWDPPIDPTAPQARPNDNFGSYSLSFQKNGGVSVGIPGATPTTRVPNIWPGPLPAGAAGTLADWDIVGALDGGPGPLPAGSPKLARGERCAYVISLSVTDTTHVGDSGNHNAVGPVLYAINIINDI